MSFAPQRKPAPAPATKPVAPGPQPATSAAAPIAKAAAAPKAAPAVNPTERSPKVLKSSMAGVPVEPAHSPLERQADEVSQRVQAGHQVETVKANPTIPGARPAAQAIARRAEPGAAAAPGRAPAVQPPGPGEPLPQPTRRKLEDSLGTDLSDVRVHSNAQARQQARDLDARAFTSGSDVWLGEGESPHDVGLMAHEATHVMQQREPGVAARLMRTPDPAPNPAAGPATTPAAGAAPSPATDATTFTPEQGRLVPSPSGAGGTIEFDFLQVPGFKLRNDPGSPRGDLWNAQKNSSAGLLFTHGYNRRGANATNQREKWQTDINKTKIVSHLQQLSSERPSGVDGIHYFSYNFAGAARNRAYYWGSFEEIARELTLPDWTDGHNRQAFQVDHVVELQVSNWPTNTAADNIANYEMLASGVNFWSGVNIQNDIRAKLREFVTRTEGRYGRSSDAITETYDIKFLDVRAGGRGPSELRSSQYWNRAQIEADPPAHLGHLRLSDPSDMGRDGEIGVAGREHGSATKRFAWRGGTEAVNALADEKNFLPPFELKKKYFDTDAAGAHPPNLGYFEIALPTRGRKVWKPLAPGQERVNVKRAGTSRFIGSLDKAEVRSRTEALEVDKASPIQLDSFNIGADGVEADGRVVSTIPLLRDADIRLSIRGGEARVYKTFAGPDFPVPRPFVVESSTLTLFASTESGLGAEGDVAFAIQGLGRGQIGASVTTSTPLTFSGSFDFDTRYFDPARIAFSYQPDNDQWTAAGDIGLKPNTLPGIESATGHVQYDGTTLSGALTVVPKIRAIQQGQLEFSHSEAEGSRFAGTLTLSDQIPNVRSGQLQAVLTKPPGREDFSFSATGDLESGFAGFTQRLHVEYRDGGFVVEGQGNFARGMLSGSLMVGATNYAVDDAGQRGTEPTENITAYGTGQVSVTLTPWLVATGRIRFLPNGELELFGELALPPVLNVFDEKSYNRRLASLNLDIPIIGVAVAGQRIGIFATIGAGLDLSAGIGPGQLRDTALSVTYNPSHEDQTAIHGHARFVVPAHAGLRMFVRGALGAGIPVISAELGLEAGGEIGLAGEASAEATVDWSPGHGLVLDALGSITVEPKFKFDLTGFAEVTADLWVTEIELYSKRWNLAQFEVGSNLRFGVEFPMHYQEGQPFDVNWDQVHFITPDVDVGQMMDEVIGRVV